MARIALVDDDPGILLILRVLLDRAGHRCRAFEDAEEALREFADPRSRPDLVILDLRMPRVPGLEFLDRLKAVDAGIPVIVSTASESQDDVIEALRRGAEDFIRKPVPPEILEASVRRVLAAATMARQNAELLSRLRDQNTQLRQHHLDVEKELGIARRVQDWMMKTEFAPMCRFAFHRRHVAATQVTGDFIDVVSWPGSSRRGVVFVDIAGHGVSAALMAPVFRLLVRQCLESPGSPAAAVGEIYRRGNEFFADGRYASLLYVLLDDDRGTATVAKGGQEPALVVRAATGAVEAVNPYGYAIGMDVAELLGEDVVFEEIEIALEPGDRIALYTDGLTEAAPRPGPGEPYGGERLRAFLGSRVREPMEAVTEALFNEVLFHTGSRHFLDDATIALVERRAPDEEAA